MIPLLSFLLKYNTGKAPIRLSTVLKNIELRKTHLKFQTNVAFAEMDLQQYKWHCFVALCFVSMAILNVWLHTLKITGDRTGTRNCIYNVVRLFQYTPSKIALEQHGSKHLNSIIKWLFYRQHTYAQCSSPKRKFCQKIAIALYWNCPTADQDCRPSPLLVCVALQVVFLLNGCPCASS